MNTEFSLGILSIQRFHRLGRNPMFLRRYYRECLSHASYMVADETTKKAAIVDPRGDIEAYIEDAQDRDFCIVYLALTHFSPDFVSGHIQLRDRVGAEICLSAHSSTEFAHRSLSDGDNLSLGNVRLQTMETPGTTPEAITLILYDDSRDAKHPIAAFTGNTLLIGDVGRPISLASNGVTTMELSEKLYDSLQTKLMKLPDETMVYPARGPGSICGNALSEEPVSTIGEQKRYNYALQPMTKSQFIALVSADQPEAPGCFVQDAIMNRRERELLETSLARKLHPMTPEQLIREQKEHAQVVDTRDSAAFAAAHFSGSINIGIDGKYANWAETMLSKDLAIAVIAEAERIAESISRLGRVGLDNVAGYLQGGIASLEEHDQWIASTHRATASVIKQHAGAFTAIDVRAENEWEAGHIPDSLNFPLPSLQSRIDEIPRNRPLIVYCKGGYRSSIAASLLQRAGYPLVYDLIGGYKAWVQANLPTNQAIYTR